MKRWLYLLHRWSGITLALVMALWFVSGMVMLYVGYPKLTTAERLAALPPLPAQGCCVPLEQALQAAGLKAPTQWRLSSVAGQPRYIFGDGRKALAAVDARSGQRIGGVTPDEALAAARHFGGAAQPRYDGELIEDAWTHSKALDAHRPLHRVALEGDAQGRWLYVSGVTGEVVRDATQTERSWGWLGAWLHWLYVFRGGALDAWWTDIVIWLAIAGGVLGASGLLVGIWRWRFTGRYKSGSRSPYRAGWMRWHHLLGLGGGLLALTWVLSGLFSMNPWKMFDPGAARPDLRAYAGGPLQAGSALPAERVLAQLAEHGLQARELEWQRVGGIDLVRAQGGAGGSWLLDAQGLREEALPQALLMTAAQRLLPQARIVERELLTEFDAYYYAREPHTMGGQRERPLPVWRLRFDDAAAHWVYVDPHSGAIVHSSSASQRLGRWLFAFLHSFDLPALLATRPLWDAWMLGFSLAGLGLSLSGLVIGWRRLRPQGRRRPG